MPSLHVCFVAVVSTSLFWFLPPTCAGEPAGILSRLKVGQSYTLSFRHPAADLPKGTVEVVSLGPDEWIEFKADYQVVTDVDKDHDLIRASGSYTAWLNLADCYLIVPALEKTGPQHTPQAQEKPDK